MLCIGHRGARGHEPENTIRGIRRALAMGVRGIEIDVHAVHGRLLVIHDDSLTRVAGVDKQLHELTFDELRKLDVGSGEQIPLLEEVLAIMPHEILFNIEMKGKGCASLLVPILSRHQAPEQLLVSSFHHLELRQFHMAMPSIATGILLCGMPLRMVSDARECGATHININLENATPDVIEEIHQAGMKVLVYTVNNPQDIERMRTLGVDGIFTDFPDRV